MNPSQFFGAISSATKKGSFSIRGTIITPLKVIIDGVLVVSQGTVKRVYEDFEEARKDGERPIEAPYFVAPGFVDMHIHGGFGFDSLEAFAKPSEFLSFREKLAANGTTSFCATLATAKLDLMKRCAQAISSSVEKGSRVIGVHFEGPFINPNRAGAQDRSNILKPNLESAQALIEGVERQRVKPVFTMAPELRDALEVARFLKENSAVVSAGHTDATYEEAVEGFRAGFTHVTHLYNAMRPFSHRDPGIIGAALEHLVTVDLVLDGHHVDPSVARSVVLSKGARRVGVISDALPVAGKEGVTLMFAGKSVHTSDGVAKLEDGTIAGSISFQSKMVDVGVRKAGIDLVSVLTMMTKTPAEIIGRDDLGELKEGAVADVVFLEKSTLKVVGSMVRGSELFFERQSARAKKGYWMYHEIYEQPYAIRRTLELAQKKTLHIARLIARKTHKIMYLVGSGSSYHAAVALRFALNRFSGVHSVPIPSSEFEGWVTSTEAQEAVVVAISQSGESVDTLNAVRHAKSLGIPVLCATNTRGSSLERLADFSIPVSAGVERAVTATKSFTSTLATLELFAVELGAERGVLSASESTKAKSELYSIPEILCSVVVDSDWACHDISLKLSKAKAVFTMGTSASYAVALEAALKLKEAANLYAEGFALREFLHGPVQLLGKDTFVIVFDLPTSDSSDLIQRFSKFGSQVVDVSFGKAKAIAHYNISLGEQPIDSVFSPIILAIPAQLLAYHTSLVKGLNPDKPEKLKKVVGGV